MSLIVPAIQAVVRHELDGVRALEFGIVTEAFTKDHLTVNVRIRGSALELQHVPVAVGRLGTSVAPRAGDLAVLGFVNGELNGAVVLGFVYDDKVKCPDAKPEEIVYKVPDDEADGIRRLELELPNGNTLTVEDTMVTITMGGTTLTIEADGNIVLDAAGDLALSAAGSVSIEAGSSLTIEAKSDVSVKGLSVAVEGSTEAKLKGATVSIAGMSSFSAS